jgi:eukaryotic-like serine/threonine-protein kinase
MATVHLCTDIRSGVQVAVKLLRAEVSNVVAKERFFREIAFTSTLDHPSIPKVFESGVTADGMPYYSMEYVDGESLRDRMRRQPRLPVDDVLRIASAVAAPMTYAHARGIVHRDVKPENILLSGDRVCVLDFGLARAIADAAGARLTGTGISVGTPAYMSPEQVRADRSVDYRSDIYSFGCIVYEMLAGAPPFKGATIPLLMAARFTKQPTPISAMRRDVPARMQLAIQRAMARTPNSRWQTADEFAAELQSAAIP